MKVIKLYLLLFCTIIVSCKQETKEIKIPLTDHSIKEIGLQLKKDDTIFTNNGKLDIVKLKEIGLSSTANTLIDNEQKQPIIYYYSTTLTDGTYMYISGNNLNGYSKSLREKDSPFETYYGYYTSGNLKNTGDNYVKKFIKGIWYNFDEQGILIDYKNYDEPYPFHWDNLQVLLKEQKIENNDIKRIFRGKLNDAYAWEIIYVPEELVETNNAKVLTVDSKSGQILDISVQDISGILN